MARTVLVPAWILLFGVGALVGPVYGTATSVSLVVAGLVLVPALILVAGRVLRRTPAVAVAVAAVVAVQNGTDSPRLLP